ncbi:hypothetical protein Hanom_Chr12g01134031 [Helianthus anomalus]
MKTKEEILKEKTYKERCIVGYRIEEMEKEYEEAKNFGRYDKKRECYVNSKGEPVVNRKEVVFTDVLAVIPLSGEYYSNVEKDKDYIAEEKKVEDEKEKEEAVGEEAATEEQQNEEDLKKKEEADVKIEKLVEVIDADDAAEEHQKKEADQKQMEEKVEVPITEVNISTDSEVLNKNAEQCKKCMETCSACTEKDEKFRTRDLEFTKIEKVFKEKCKEM